tara:strand:- start:1146 stop:1715 length:570 start_codon:yes stop_codon:yes gene_type:complete
MKIDFKNIVITNLKNLDYNFLEVNDILSITKNPIYFVHIRTGESVKITESNFKYINILETGDRFDVKICDRCFKLKPTNDFQNNRIKKGGLITKRPSCKSCRKIKDGISISTEDRKLWDQKKPKIGDLFRCPICEKTSIAGVSKHVLDHNHKTGKVRGFLCESCNTGIGRFDDNIKITKNAINWLNQNN